MVGADVIALGRSAVGLRRQRAASEPHPGDGNGAVAREGANLDGPPRPNGLDQQRQSSCPCSGLTCIRAPVGMARAVSARSSRSTCDAPGLRNMAAYIRGLAAV